MIKKNKINYSRTLIFCLFLFHLPIKAEKNITTEDIKAFSRHLHKTYGKLWTELEDKYRNKQGVSASQYQKHLNSLENAPFQIVEIKTPFIHIRRVGISILNGFPSVCNELWIKKNDSFICISNENAHKIIVGNFDNNEYPDAIVIFGCCASYGIQILCSEQDPYKLDEWYIRKVFEKNLNSEIKFDSTGKCEILKIAFKQKNDEDFKYLKTCCENDQLIVKDTD